MSIDNVQSSGASAPSAAAPSSAPSSPAPTTSGTRTGGTPSAAKPAPGAQSQPSPSSPTQVPQKDPSTTGGEPPQERWADILNNARTKTRAEVEAEFKQKYGKYDAFEQDPWTAVQNWLDQAVQHDYYAPQVQRWLQSYIEAVVGSQPGEEPQPDVPIVDAHGNPTGEYTYSAKGLRAWNEWKDAQTQAALDQRLGPVEKLIEQQRQEQAASAAVREVSQQVEWFRKQPYFKENEERVRQIIEENPNLGPEHMHAVWNYVLSNEVIPKLSQSEQQKVLDSIQQKASGASVAPGGTAPGKPQFSSFKEAAEYYNQHPEEAAAAAKR